MKRSPIVPQHRIVTTLEHGGTRNYCLDCGAHRSGVHPPQPPCRGSDAGD
jgi:hypothetical protein